VEVPGAVVLVIRSGQDYPDIVNDVETISDELEFEDIDGLTDVCIVGNQEIIGIKIDVINTMMEKRMGEDAKIVEDLYNKLENDYEVLLFESEHDAHRKLRLGIRLPMDMKSINSIKLPEILTKVDIPARKAKVVYIIANDDYLRIYGKRFYDELTEFAAGQTPRTIEEEQDIQNQVRGGMADYFVEDIDEDTTFQKTIPDIEEELKSLPSDKSLSETPQEPELEPKEKKSTKKPSKRSSKKRSSKSSKKTEDQPSEPRPERPAAEINKVIDDLRPVLNRLGYVVSSEYISDIDIIAYAGEMLEDDNRETQIFIKFIEEPSLKDMIKFEKRIEEFKVKYGVVVSKNPTTDSKIFSVGKKILVVSPEDFEQEVSSI
jgi:hypothetical protein